MEGNKIRRKTKNMFKIINYYIYLFKLYLFVYLYYSFIFESILFKD